MINRFSRTDNSLLGRWWWSIDRHLFFSILALSIIGGMMVFSASTSVAEHLKLPPYFFFIKQIKLLLVAILAMISVSLLPIIAIRRLALLGLIGIIVLLIITPILGSEIKGATRWIRIAGFNLQVTEFAKPIFAVCSAWLFATHFEGKNIPGVWLATGLYLILASLFIIQPDFGQTVLLSAIWASQFIIAGLPFVIIFFLLGLAFAFIILGYFTMEHVRVRIDKWLDPSSGDTYQITKSLEAFADGGWLGVGPGNGNLKNTLPDVHADFIYAVVGEETGILGGIIIIGLFSYIIYRILKKTYQKQDLFIILTLVGLTTQFAVQTAINLSSTMGLIPSKGMTLPFISYGGSSLLAMGLSMGVILSFTRKRFD